MTYQLPEPSPCGYKFFYTEAQMHAAYQAGQADAREDLTIAYMAGYSKGRDSMKAECVKVCESIINTYTDWDNEYFNTAVRGCIYKIKELK